MAPRKRLTDDVPEQPPLAQHPHPVLRQLKPLLKSFLGTADNNYPVIVRGPGLGRPSTFPSRRPTMYCLQLCLDYIDRVFGAGSERARKVTPRLRAVGNASSATPGGYYTALTKEHVDVEASEPARVNERGIVTQDGRQIDLDVDHLRQPATTSTFLATVDIGGARRPAAGRGVGGRPSAYRVRLVPGFPESVHLLGPELQPRPRGRPQLRRRGVVHYVMGVPQPAWPGRVGRDPGVNARGVRGLCAAVSTRRWRRTVWLPHPTAHTYYRSGGGRIVTAFPFRLIDVWQSHRAPKEEDLLLR